MKGDFINWGLSALSVDKIWEYTKGEKIRIAILDTGIDLEHPDLPRDCIIEKDDFTGSGNAEDTYGHGTHIAGIIGARSTGSGVIGVAPESNLLIAKISDDKNPTSLKPISDAVKWAIEKKANIINLSLETTAKDDKLHAIIKEAVQKNIFVIASTGNTNTVVKYPARHDEVLAVGSVDYDGKHYVVYEDSGRGKEIHVVAPGVDIQSCWINKGYKKESGTSMAAAFVSGCVALMLSYQNQYSNTNRIETQVELIDLIKNTAISGGPQGFDHEYGHGIINPQELVLRKA